METKVQHFGESANLPAGIFSGTELFAHNGEMYAIRNGSRMLFQDLPSMEKRNFVEMYMQDKAGQDFIRQQFGVIGFESGFKQWLFCKFGSLDGDPDGIDGRITPDSYNSACLRTDCSGRGKFCGTVAGLKSYEVETLAALRQGLSAKQIAARLYLSVPAVKSRIERLKEKFRVANVVALVAMAADLGI